MALKFRNPKFNILRKIAFFLNKIPTVWSLKLNKTILEQMKAAEKDDYIYFSFFFKRERPRTQN